MIEELVRESRRLGKSTIVIKHSHHPPQIGVGSEDLKDTDRFTMAGSDATLFLGNRNCLFLKEFDVESLLNRCPFDVIFIEGFKEKNYGLVVEDPSKTDIVAVKEYLKGCRGDLSFTVKGGETKSLYPILALMSESGISEITVQRR